MSDVVTPPTTGIRKGLPVLLGVSFALAAVSFAAQVLIHDFNSVTGPLVVALTGAWCVTVVLALVRHGRSGVWALLGAPFALFGLFVIASIVGGCMFADRCP